MIETKTQSGASLQQLCSAAGLRLLDLFCCEGGAGNGYARAGFDVTGVDIVAKPRNPHPVIVADAIEYARKHAHEYDAIHASPPCQSYSKAMKHLATPQPMLIDAVREILEASGKPWVIENVVGAPLANDSDLFGRHGVELCGTMFGLRIYRHRIFETNFQLPLPPAPCDHSRHAMNPHKAEGRERIYAEHGRQDPEKLWAAEMGVEWMSRHGAREAVPPCFTEWMGRELAKTVRRQNEKRSDASEAFADASGSSVRSMTYKQSDEK